VPFKALGPDWFASKICHAKDLVSHDFGWYLVCYQNLPNSYIWIVKSMAIVLPNFWLDKSLV
jgi:hypothetical protein